MRARHGAIVASTLAAGCTFAGLADYQVIPCNPHAVNLADDACFALTFSDRSRPVPDDCTAVYQCVGPPLPDGATPGTETVGHCERRPLDADKDGDPSNACGGGDCDDGNPSRSSLFADDTCDGVDENCNALVDDGAPWFLASLKSEHFDQPTRDVTFAWSGTAFVATFLRAGSDAGPFASPCIAQQDVNGAPRGCALLGDEDVAVRHPFARTDGEGVVAAVFSRTDRAAPGCSSTLAFRNSAGGRAEEPCLGTDVSHPSLIALDDGSYALAVYSDAPLDAPPAGCDALPEHPLRFRWIRHPFRADASFDASGDLTATSAATGPVSLALLGAVTGELDVSVAVVAPEDGGLSVWALSPPSDAAATFLRVAHWSDPPFTGVRGAGIAVTSSDTAFGPSTAIVASLGCGQPDVLQVGKGGPGAAFADRPLVLPRLGDAPTSLPHPRASVAWAGGEWQALVGADTGAYVYRVAPVPAPPPPFVSAASSAGDPSRYTRGAPIALPNLRDVEIGPGGQMGAFDDDAQLLSWASVGCR